MRNKFFAIFFTVLLIACISVSYFFIKKHNCNNLIMAATLIGEGNTTLFDEKGLLEYKFLSSRLRTSVDEKTFANIKTWFDADDVFQKIQHPDNLYVSYTLTYNKPIESNEKKYIVNYNVYFVNSLFGYKIDYIDISIQPQ